MSTSPMSAYSFFSPSLQRNNQIYIFQPSRCPYVNYVVCGLEGRTAWPRESGLMSRNAMTFSDSKSLKEGMSPVVVSVR